MANQQHLDLLHQGVTTWETWRRNSPGVQPDLSFANLSFANLSFADLHKADLSFADLSGASLRYANFSGASLIEATLGFAALSFAVLHRADLSGADLSFADLSGADLSGADLSFTKLTNANLTGSTMGETILGELNLRTSIGLEVVRHRGPSHLSINTLYKSEGSIPETFVRGTGAPDTFLEYMRVLASQPIDYYTCLISYSSRDELFARRLHNDLQQEGVRCWFAPEDLSIGNTIRHRIEKSIKRYDKLLLILSEHSLASSWVEYEVERALNKEPQGTPNVLYPVRVDQAVMTCSAAWARKIKNTRHIGDFEHWTDPKHYEANFKRLLRALNTRKDQLQK